MILESSYFCSEHGLISAVVELNRNGSNLHNALDAGITTRVSHKSYGELAIASDRCRLVPSDALMEQQGRLHYNMIF